MGDERPVESRFQEYVEFAKKHKLATVLILVWLVAPTIWSVVVTLKGWNADELEATIGTQSQVIAEKNAKIQELQTLLIPFKTIAIEKYTGTEKEVLGKLADHLTSVDAELKRAQAQLQELKTTVSDLKPAFKLLEHAQTRDGDTWVTRVAFGSKIGHPFARFAVAVAFDKPYESAKPFVTGQGMVITGELKTLEGAENSRIFRFVGTQLLANNYLVVEFRSKEQIQLVALNLEPRSE